MFARTRSGQVRVFSVHIQNTPVTCTGTGSFVRDWNKDGEGVRGGGSKGGGACTGEYKGVQAVRPESVAGGGWFEVLWNLECPVGLSQREICVHFNEWRLDGPSKNKELLSYVVIFEFNRPKVADIILLLPRKGSDIEREKRTFQGGGAWVWGWEGSYWIPHVLLQVKRFTW